MLDSKPRHLRVAFVVGLEVFASACSSTFDVDLAWHLVAGWTLGCPGLVGEELELRNLCGQNVECVAPVGQLLDCKQFHLEMATAPLFTFGRSVETRSFMQSKSTNSSFEDFATVLAAFSAAFRGLAVDDAGVERLLSSGSECEEPNHGT